MAWMYYLNPQCLGPCNCSVYVVNFEPQKQSISRRHVVWIADRSVMMFHVPPMQLQYQIPGDNEAFVVRPAVIAFTIEQLLIPPAAHFNISDANQGLWSHIIPPIVFN